MSMAIGTNGASITSQRHLKNSRADMETSMERLSSGKRINSAMDDAAGLAIAGRMSAQVEGMSMAVKNANDGVSMLQTAEGGLEETTDILLRMRELAVQASSDTYSATDRAALDSEFDVLKAEITRISDRTDFNGASVLNSTDKVDIQVGADSGDTISFTFRKMGSTSIGSVTKETATTGGSSTAQSQTFATALVAGQSATYTVGNNTYTQAFVAGASTPALESKATLDALASLVATGEGMDVTSGVADASGTILTFTTLATAELGVAKTMGPPLSEGDFLTKANSVSAINNIDAALLEVASYRGDLGATPNRLTHTVDNLMNRIEHTSAARSHIEDTNFAYESARLAQSQVQQQAGTAMLAQANAYGQFVMSLLK